MADNFDLKKFLKENKALENLNPSLKSINENESREERADVDAYEYEKGEEAEKKKMTKEAMKKQIKDMIVAELELSVDDPGSADAKVANLYDPVYEGDKTPEEKAEEDEALLDGGFGSFEEGYPEEIEYEEDTYDYSNDFYDDDNYGDSNDFGDTDEFDLEEAKKKDKVEDVEVTDTDVEDVSVEDEMPADEAPADVTGGLEDISADMKGTEADLMDHLMKAFQIAKGMGNEKLETQVGNTLKFFVSEYIGGGEQ
jgi:hypothetical protein